MLYKKNQAFKFVVLELTTRRSLSGVIVISSSLNTVNLLAILTIPLATQPRFKDGRGKSVEARLHIK